MRFIMVLPLDQGMLAPSPTSTERGGRRPCKTSSQFGCLGRAQSALLQNFFDVIAESP